MNVRTGALRGAALVLGMMCLQAQGQEGPGTGEASSKAGAVALHDEIALLDAAMFDAFNSHDLDAMMSLFSVKLEFYHDTGGLQSYVDVKEGFKTIFARNDGIRRELVKGSLEVFPVKGYGAIEVGAHRFCHVEQGRDECGTFRFLHVWEKVGRTWKVARVVSYGH